MYSSRTRKFLDWCIYKLRAKFSGVLTIEEVKKRKLKYISNVHGDFISIAGYRSLWSDKYGNIYRCNRLKIEIINHIGLYDLKNKR